MWLLTPRGFFSVVAHTARPEDVLVRARVREDLEALRELAGDFDIEETPERDYRFRTILPRETWTAALVTLVSEIDYPNFKNAVAARQGKERASVYGKVWSILYGLQR